MLLRAAFSAALAAAAAAALAAPTAGSNVTMNAPMPGVVNVFIICHSHDDVGWLKTPQQYYTGSSVIGIDPDGDNLPSVYYANGAVQFILTSVVQSLSMDPRRMFTVVEQYFFQRWYLSQSPSMQALTQSMVAAGQLVFANGGMVMHDEAAPTYVDMIGQTEAGVRWISATFGEAALPRVTSQLDPFGHSATQAAYMASPAAGYMATFHARMDYEEVAQRAATQSMDFAWAPSTSLGLSAVTMGALGYFGYSPPDGFCLDIGIECQGEGIFGGLNNPVSDDAFPDAEENNVQLYVNQVLQTAQQQASAYPRAPDGTVLLPWTMGDDFQWQAAHQNFASVDKLIQYVNANTSIHGVHLLYATQASYATARINSGAALQLKTSDAMPYADGPHNVWSGYFTSRPALKAFVRDSSAMFQAAKQLQAWVEPPVDTGITNPLWCLETSVAVAQHHDAVAGTAKQVVSYDYAKRLQQGRDTAGVAMSRWLNKVSKVDGTASAIVWSNCDLANATLCALTEDAGASNATVALNIYNSGSQARAGVRAAVRIPVPIGGASPSWAVLSSDGVTPITAQLVPASPADAALRTTYYNASAAAMAWLCFFPPTGVPAAGFVTVFIRPAASALEAPFTHASRVQHSMGVTRLRSPREATPTLSNGVVTLTFDAVSGLLSSFASSSPSGASSVQLTQNLLYYTSSQGDAADGQASGAYIFRPVGTSATPIATTSNTTLISGPIVSEAWQVFAPWATQVMRLWNGTVDGFDCEWTIGPIPVTPLVGPGKEVVSRWTAAAWTTNATWFTDSNGRELQKRIRNARPDYPLNLTEPIAMNMYPVNTAMRMSDDASGAIMTLVTPVTQAGGSMSDGNLEIMVHRRLVVDDSRGVLEPLNEPGLNDAGLVARSTHRIILSSTPVAATLSHKVAVQDIALLPLQWRGGPLPAGMTPAAWIAGGALTSDSLLAAPLPPNAFLLTAHAWNSSTLLVRVAHLFEVDDPVNAGNVTLSIGSMFNPAVLTVSSAVEMTLMAGQPLANVPPVTYSITASSSSAATASPLLPRLGLGDLPAQHRPSNAKVAAAAAVASAEAVGDGAVAAAGGATATVQQVTLPIVPPAPVGPDFAVTLAPMQIRTFLCTVQWVAAAEL